jgi:hypothetical protein
MKSLGNIIAFIIIMAMITIIIYFMYQGSLLVWDKFEILEYTTRIILTTFALVMIIASLILMFGMRSAAFIRAQSQLAEKRQSLYSHYLTLLRALLDQGYSRDQRQEFIAELMTTNAEFLLLASAPTVKAFMAFQDSLKADDCDILEPCFQALWKNMRKDLGYKNDFEVVDVKELLAILPGHVLLEMQTPDSNLGPVSESVSDTVSKSVPGSTSGLKV